MAKYLRHFAVDFDPRSLAANFPFTAQFVFDLFALEFGKCPSKNIGKLLVYLVSDASRHLSAEDMIDVLAVYEHLDEGTIQTTSEFALRKFVLDSILLAIRAHGPTYGWDVAQAETTHARVLEAGIVFDRGWGKPARHPKSKLSVQAHAKFYCPIELTLHVFDAKRQLLQVIRVAELPGTIGALLGACGSLAWIDESHVRLTMKNGRDYWDADLNAGQAVFHYPRAEKGDPHGQYDFGRMYLEGYIVDRDESQSRHWFTLAAAQGFNRARTALERLTPP